MKYMLYIIKKYVNLYQYINFINLSKYINYISHIFKFNETSSNEGL